jgi:hypothetical protein
VFTRGTFIKNCLPFIYGPQLHSIKKHFRMPTFRAGLFNLRIFFNSFILDILVNPSWFHFWGASSGDFGEIQINKFTSIRASIAASKISLWCIHYCSTLGAKWPRHISTKMLSRHIVYTAAPFIPTRRNHRW